MRSVDSASVWAPEVGPAVIPCLALTVALHSRLSNKTSRLHRCELGRAVGCSACPLRSGGGPTECAPGSPCGRGSLRLRGGVGFLPLFCCFYVSFPLALLGGGTRNCTKRSTTCSRPERPMVMRVRLIPYGRRGLFSVPCSLGCMTPRTPRTAVCTGPLGRNGE